MTTTLDAGLQRTVEGIVAAERPALDRAGAHNVAVVVLDNATGGWLAWEGSGDYGDTANGGAIDGAIAPRQPGSALKPFTYAVAFEQGESPATALPDVPSYFPTGQEGVLYGPRNYDGRFRGPLLARTALAGSENVPAVSLASRVGVPNLLRFLRGAGFTTFDRTAAYYGLGVTLGDAEVRLDEMVAAYAAFARGGDRRSTDVRSRRSTTPARPRCASSRSGRRSGSPTSCRTTTRGRLRSAAAAASSFRSGSRRRPARRRAITTTGPSATRARSPSASGSAISITGRSSGRPA